MVCVCDWLGVSCVWDREAWENGLGDSDVFVPDCGVSMTDKRVDWERTI